MIPWSVKHNGVLVNNTMAKSSDGDTVVAFLCETTTLARHAQDMNRLAISDITTAVELGQMRTLPIDRFIYMSEKFQILKHKLVPGQYAKQSSLTISRHAVIIGALATHLVENTWAREGLSYAPLRYIGNYGYYVGF